MTFETSFLLIADTNPVAILEATDVCPGFFHCTNDFMTWNYWKFCVAPVVVYDLNISSCNTAMGDFHHDVISADLSFIAKRLRLSTRPFNSEGFYFHGDSCNTIKTSIDFGFTMNNLSFKGSLE